jgi:opacity protein-like surface antigen
MNQRNRQTLTLAATVWGLVQFFGVLVRAELLIEEKNQPAALTSADSSVEASGQPSSSRITAQPVQPVVIAPQAYPVQPVIFTAAPVAAPVAAPLSKVVSAPSAAASPSEEGREPSRMELVRRERMRQELQNEDILQERLEELRLQDEKRRTSQVLGTSDEKTPAVTEQVVSVPVTERAAGTSVSSAVATVEQESSADVTTLRLTPRFGMPGFQGQSSYNLQGRYAVGAGVDVGFSDHLSFELGYTYGEYGVGLNSATAAGLGPLVGGWGWNYNPNNTTGVLRQNVVDAGIKLHMLGRQSKLRPFIGGGAGYSRSFLNYDQRIVNYMRQFGFNSPDYDLTQFLANASAGVELQLSKSVVVGLTYRYFTVLSSRQNTELFNPALYGAFPVGGFNPYGYGYGYGYGLPGAGSFAELEKQVTGGTLANTNFYSVMATVGFSF